MVRRRTVPRESREREPRCYVRCPRCRTWLAETPRERLRFCPHCGLPFVREWPMR